MLMAELTLPTRDAVGLGNPLVALSVTYNVAEREAPPVPRRQAIPQILRDMTATPDEGPLVRATHKAGEAAAYAGTGELVTEAQPLQ